MEWYRSYAATRKRAQHLEDELERYGPSLLSHARTSFIMDPEVTESEDDGARGYNGNSRGVTATELRNGRREHRAEPPPPTSSFSPDARSFREGWLGYQGDTLMDGEPLSPVYGVPGSPRTVRGDSRVFGDDER